MPQNLQTLPTEIQREIYRSLLLGSRLRTGTTTYKFNTGILSVSKGVFSISHQVLYNENDFVLIGDGTMKLMQNLRLMRVPIVSCHVPEFKEHRLSISFGEYIPSPSKSHQSGIVPCPKGPGSSCSLGSIDCDLPILLHAQDSALYIRAFAILEHCIWYPICERTLVTSERDVRPLTIEVIGGPHEVAVVVIGVEMNSYDKQDLDKSWKQMQWQSKERELLNPFRGMSGTRRIVWKGVEVMRPHSFIRELQETMSPPVIWLQAMGWHLVRILRSLKSDLDALLRGEEGKQEGCICQALFGYQFLYQTLNLATVCKPEYIVSTSFGNLDWQDALCAIALDTAYTLLHVLFYQGHHSVLSVASSMQVPPWSNFLQSRGTYARLSTPKQHRILTHFRTIDLAAHGMIQSALQNLKQEINQAITDRASEEEIEHLRRDLTYLRIHFQGEQYPEITLPGRNSTGPNGDKPTLLACAHVKLKKPLGTYIFPDSVVIQGPDGNEGWLDIKERLTDDDLESLGVSATDLPAGLLAEE